MGGFVDGWIDGWGASGGIDAWVCRCVVGWVGG